jgi:hypothetical protein
MRNSALLTEVLKWHMVPDYMYHQIPAAPSLIYGAHHLLRMFGEFRKALSNQLLPLRKISRYLLFLSFFKNLFA